MFINAQAPVLETVFRIFAILQANNISLFNIKGDVSEIALFLIDRTGNIQEANTTGVKLSQKIPDLINTHNGKSRIQRFLQQFSASPGLSVTESHNETSLNYDAVPCPNGQVVLISALETQFSTRLKSRFGLTDKEIQTAALLMDGLSSSEISEYVSRSKETIRTHVKSITKKLDVKSSHASVSKLFKLLIEHERIRQNQMY